MLEISSCIVKLTKDLFWLTLQQSYKLTLSITYFSKSSTSASDVGVMSYLNATMGPGDRRGDDDKLKKQVMACPDFHEFSSAVAMKVYPLTSDATAVLKSSPMPLSIILLSC